MLPPIIVILLSVEFFTMTANRQPPDLGPYDGPLAERQVTGVHPELSTIFTIEVDNDQLATFARWLIRNPIYVRAPDEKYLIFGLKIWPGASDEILVLNANLLLNPSEQPLGPWLPDPGAMLAWAFSVMDHYDLDYDPQRQFHGKSREALLELYRQARDPVDWHAVAERLRSTGRPVPDDLFDKHD